MFLIYIGIGFCATIKLFPVRITATDRKRVARKEWAGTANSAGCGKTNNRRTGVAYMMFASHRNNRSGAALPTIACQRGLLTNPDSFIASVATPGRFSTGSCYQA